jgi:hypothetical protein
MGQPLRFDLPIWAVEILHHNPKSDGVWNVAVNADDQSSAMRRAVALFVSEGLNELLVDIINVSLLTPLTENTEGGET